MKKFPHLELVEVPLQWNPEKNVCKPLKLELCLVTRLEQNQDHGYRINPFYITGLFL